MSRVAAAAAYELNLAYEPSPSPRPTTGYRVLGYTERASRPVQQLAYVRATQQRQLHPYLELVDEEPAHPYSLESQSRRGIRRWPQVEKRWLVGVGAVLAILALAVGSPVLASGIASRSRSLPRLSAYHDVVTTGSLSGAQPIIDLRTGTGITAPAVVAPEPPKQTSANNYELVGAPSVSVTQIDSVLRQYASPAQGLGQALYDGGVRYSIDPAYALAFFVHESGCGTKGVARSTKSIGNIRWTSGYDNFEGYRSYSTWEAGIDDWYKLISDLYINGWNLRTVDAIVPVYAPSGDNNNPVAYISSVKGMVDNWRGK